MTNSPEPTAPSGMAGWIGALSGVASSDVVTPRATPSMVEARRRRPQPGAVRPALASACSIVCVTLLATPDRVSRPTDARAPSIVYAMARMSRGRVAGDAAG